MGDTKSQKATREPKPPKPPKPQYTVLRDTREQQGWTFPADENCLGTTTQTLPTGDYALQGIESVFVIERKASTAEIIKNLTEERFERELVRLDEFLLPFIICEFDYADVLRFPVNSGIPRMKWPRLRVTANFLAKRLAEIQLQHKVRLLFAGLHGPELATALFKRVFEQYAPQA